MSYLDEIEAIKNSDLDAEAKKKAIKKLRRQHHKSVKATLKHSAPEVEDPELAKLSVDEMLQQLISDSQLTPGDKKDQAYFYYSVRNCVEHGIPFSKLLEKFQARWGFAPAHYATHVQGSGDHKAVFFGLGPTIKVGQ